MFDEKTSTLGRIERRVIVGVNRAGLQQGDLLNPGDLTLYAGQGVSTLLDLRHGDPTADRCPASHLHGPCPRARGANGYA